MDGMGEWDVQAYYEGVLRAARREMRREMELLAREGMPPRRAGLSERFLDAQDAAKHAEKEMERIQRYMGCSRR